MTKPTAIYLGSSIHSAQVLKTLIDSNQLTLNAIITNPDRKIGRHQDLTPSPIATLADKHQLPIHKLADLTTVPKDISKPDYLITVAYGQLIPPHWLSFPQLLALNLHPSLLPAYRGSSPVPWAILDGTTTTGITLMQLDAKFDTGQILGQQAHPILPTDTTTSLLQKLFDLGTTLLIDHISKTPNPHLYSPPRPQPTHSPTPYARKLTKKDGYIPLSKVRSALIDHHATTRQLDLMMRALWPWPGVWTNTTKNIRVLLQNGYIKNHTYHLTEIKPAGKNTITNPDIIQAILT